MNLTVTLILSVLGGLSWAGGATASVCCRAKCVAAPCLDCHWVDGNICGTQASCDACPVLRAEGFLGNPYTGAQDRAVSRDVLKDDLRVESGKMKRIAQRKASELEA